MERLTERFENGQVGVAGCGKIANTATNTAKTQKNVARYSTKFTRSWRLMRMPRNRKKFYDSQSVKIHRCIPSSIVVEITKAIGLECVLEDFARILQFRGL